MIITRTLLALGLAALLSVAGSGSSPASAQTDCLDGRALGQWNLPSRIERGVVRGLLVQETRDGRKFALDARLAPIRGTDGGKLDGNQYKRVNVHWIEAERQMRGLGVSSKLNARMDFLLHLREIGRQVADRWIASHFDAIGQRSTIDVREKFL